MWHQQVVGIAAGSLDTDPTRCHAMVIHSLEATRALAAANPGTHQAILSHGDIFRIGTCGDDGDKGFMPERHRRLHAALAHVKTLAPSQVEVAIANMHVAVAHPAI